MHYTKTDDTQVIMVVTTCDYSTHTIFNTIPDICTKNRMCSFP